MGTPPKQLRNIVRTVLTLAATSGAFALAGCSIDYDYPDTPPHKEEVFAAAREVLHERYPMSSSTEKHQQLYAVTGIDLEGNSRSRKQISIYVSRNWTGAYEPTISVVQFVDDWTEPPLRGSDPGSDLPARTSLHPMARWRPLQRLPMEEKALYDAIMGKLLTSMAPPEPAPEPQSTSI